MEGNKKETIDVCHNPIGNTRVIYLDFISGVLITKMMLGHYLDMSHLLESNIAKVQNIFFFFMPWFFFKSGMFLTMATPMEPFISSNAKRLMIPFFVFSIIGTMIGTLTNILLGESMLGALKNDIISFIYHGSTMWAPHLWFLSSLFFVKIFYKFICRKVNDRILLLISISVAYLHMLYIAKHDIFWIGNLCSGLFFLISGKILAERQYKKFYSVSAFLLLLFIAIIAPVYVTMFGNFVLFPPNGHYLIWYPFSLCGIIVVNNIARLLPLRMVENQILSFVGRHSLYFYIFHYTIAMSISHLYYAYSNEKNNWECLFYLCLYGLGIVPLYIWRFRKGVLAKVMGR